MRHKPKQEFPAVRQLLSGKGFILAYDRDKHGRHTGVVLAFKDANGDIKVGWSKCNVTLEGFDKHVGILKAMKRAIPLESYEKALTIVSAPENLPHGIKHLSEKVLKRTKKYFRL